MTDYPTDDELQRISAWPLDDPLGWIDFVYGIWRWPDWGIHRTQRRLYLSTGGWSGNESIVEAMRTHILWWVSFVSHRRGGHYALDMTRLRAARKWRAAARPREGPGPSESDAPATHRQSDCDLPETA